MQKRVFSFVLIALFVIGSAVPAEAGGFLKRCRLRRATVQCCRPTIPCCVIPAPTPALCDRGDGACCAARLTEDLDKCPEWIREDLEKYGIYQRIAGEANRYCVELGEKGTSSVAGQTPRMRCQCMSIPEHTFEHTFETCTTFYNKCMDAGSTPGSGQDATCCARCWLNCVQSLTTPPLASIQSDHVPSN